MARGRRQRLPARVAAAPDGQGHQGDEGIHVQHLRRHSFAGDFAGAFEGDAKDKHGYLRGDAKTQVRTGVDARRATLSYYQSKAKAGLPGAREVLAAELAFRTETTVRFDAIAARARIAPRRS